MHFSWDIKQTNKNETNVIIISAESFTNLLRFPVRAVNFGEEICPQFVLKEKWHLRFLTIFFKQVRWNVCHPEDHYNLQAQNFLWRKTTVSPLSWLISISGSYLERSTGSGVVGHAGCHPLHSGEFTLRAEGFHWLVLGQEQLLILFTFSQYLAYFLRLSQ